MVVAALPMAIFGILPQAVVADIAQSDAITSGSNREGMFYAARTFAFKLGQSLSMLILQLFLRLERETEPVIGSQHLDQQYFAVLAVLFLRFIMKKN